MYGVTAAYYIYLVLLTLTVIGVFASGAAAGVAGFIFSFLIALPGLLFLGWIALVLSKCRKCLNEHKLMNE